MYFQTSSGKVPSLFGSAWGDGEIDAG